MVSGTTALDNPFRWAVPDMMNVPETAAEPAGRRWAQFSLKAFFIAFTAIVCWVAWWVISARAEHDAINAILDRGGTVVFDYQIDLDRHERKPATKAVEPTWRRALRDVLGEEFFVRVFQVDFSGSSFTDEDLDLLSSLGGLRTVMLSQTGITDEAIKRFMRANPRVGVIHDNAAFLGVTLIWQAKKTIVNTVMPRSPAAAGGLEQGDAIADMNGTRVRGPMHLWYLIVRQSVGDTVSLQIERGGQNKTFDLPLTSRAILRDDQIGLP